MFGNSRSPLAACFLGLVMVSWAGILGAQPQPGDAKDPPADTHKAAPAGAQGADADRLSLAEQRIADRFDYLEEIVLRMAELTAATDPRRAVLLRKALAQSKQRLINVQFERLVDLLEKDSLSRAIENQAEIDKDLRALLELLLSENRAKRIEAEKARLRRYLKDLNRIIRQQKDVQGRTAGGGEPKRLAGEQGKLAEKTGKLATEIKKDETDETESKGKDKTKDTGKGEGESKSEGEAKGKGEGESKAEGGGKGETKGKGEGKSRAEGGGKGEGQSQGQSKGQGQAQPQRQNPARGRLEAARQRMKEAQQKLEEAQRKGAVDKQEEALEQLRQAKAELEEILRQLREEEIGRMLAMLEARFRKMLKMQREVYEGTLRLDKVPQDQRTHNDQIEAGRLGGKESQIVVEADKVLALLRDDGTAVAFPEAVEQIREDMQQVVRRLARAEVGKITQAIEEDILAALEEMIEALQKARQEADNKRQRPQDTPPTEPQDPPLVDMIAELKMIRALQVRVKRRTDRYSKLTDRQQATSPELVEALRRLAEREARIYRITRDLEMGKNR